MHRSASHYLDQWRHKPNRKPLIVRGARQVGKSYLVREFGKSFAQFIEINFEKNPEDASLFTNSIPQTLSLLETKFKTKIIPEKCLLFLDEIQSAPAVLAKLRYFYEELPALHIISAGSLLEFLLEEHDFSMPVGRIEYLYLGPMNFGEFLLANTEVSLHDFISNYKLGEKIPISLHQELMQWVQKFFLVGGMPESVYYYAKEKNLAACQEVKHGILNTYQDDFAKYGKKINATRLRRVFQKIPEIVGKKLKYVHIDPHERSKDLAQALDLMNSALVCYKVYHSHASGLPLDAQRDEKIFKILHLDIGLVSSSLGINLLDLHQVADLNLINQGVLSEQFIGQHLLHAGPFYQQPNLHYWVREKRHAAAEVDYIIPCQNRIIPIEVKSGKTGRLKSLQVFLTEKKSNLGIRFNGDVPSVTHAETSLPGQKEKFTLISLPFYLVTQVHRLMANCK